MEQKIQGVIAVPLTPFDQDGNIDYTAMEEIIEFMLGKGIHGVFSCGSISLGPLMKPEERKQVLEFIVKVNRERVPIIAQIGAADTRTAVDLASHAQSLGVDVVASIPPFYIPTDEEDMYEHFKEIKKAVEIPVYAYNNLWTGKIISPRLFKRLVDLGYQGMKDAGEDILLHYNYLRLAPPSFNLLMGNETLALPALIMGVSGFTSGTVNAFPELNLELYRSFKKGELEKAAKLQQKILQLTEILSIAPVISNMYACINLRGIKFGQPKRPLRSISLELQEKMKDKIYQLGLLEEPYY
ncbi:MAG: dihydrodipicolinate synthase family protein [Candidatus Caldatribacteriota bacterium]|nr:dihydrodipicolinate synthase family protein [Candidatus Caldatribacteriota bacterium]